MLSTANYSTAFQGMSQLLITQGLLEPSQLTDYDQQSLSLPQYLARHHILSADTIAFAAAQHFGIPWLDLDSIISDSAVFNILDKKLIEKYQVLPLFTHGNHLYLGIDDFSKQSVFGEIQFHCGLPVKAVIVETDKLHKRLQLNTQDSLQQTAEQDFLAIHPDEKIQAENNPDTTLDEAPIVRLFNKILLEAATQGASDIHIEPYEETLRIRYRIDGLLKEILQPPLPLANRLIARIKVMAEMDIAERRLPQDGRFTMALSKTQSIDCRVSSCPAITGEKMVLRLLYSGTHQPTINNLGLNILQKKLLMEAIHHPQGMIIVTGPTGSGKTATLYAVLHILNTETVNISTVEDPVEWKLSGINQVQINPKTGLHFANALRALLRQDPDIIMIGEMRDLETADIAIKAAQTGHLVLSTLHTNSAAETLTRLKNMGIPAFNIASTVRLIVAQRLVRKLCEACKKIKQDYQPQHWQALGFSAEESTQVIGYQAMGCEKCNKGYKGRVALYELLPVSRAIEHIIMNAGSSLDILEQAQREGMKSLYQSGLQKIQQGITTIEEVNRVSIA